MYTPSHFAENDIATLHKAIEDWPLGALIVATPDGLVANHVPFQLDRTTGELGTLRCHVARANDVWQNANAECLVIFQGPSAYISPNLYETKKQHGQVVPTYNYAVVHAHGRLAIHDDEKWLRGLVGHLTKRFEATQVHPWKMGDAPPQYIAERLKEIVGIEIAITRLEGKWKMSQNRPEVDQAGVVAGLRKGDKEVEREVAQIVEQRAKSASR